MINSLEIFLNIHQSGGQSTEKWETIIWKIATISVQKIKKYMKMASYSNLEIWSPLVPKTQPERQNKMALKWRSEAKIGPNAPHVV